MSAEAAEAVQPDEQEPGEQKLPPELEDIERIIADPERYTLKKGRHPGLDLRIVRLQTRQLMRLVKILTHGFSPLLTRGLDFSSPDFAQTMLMQILMAIPDAEAEAIDFIRSMCEPDGLYVAAPGSVLSEEESAWNAEQWRRTGESLFNPDPGDLLEILERIIQIEAPEIQSLGKQAGRLIAALTRLAPAATGLPSLSPDLSQPPSTLSAPSTGGPTSTSSPSPSAASGRSSTRSGTGARPSATSSAS